MLPRRGMLCEFSPPSDIGLESLSRPLLQNFYYNIAVARHRKLTGDRMALFHFAVNDLPAGTRLSKVYSQFSTLQTSHGDRETIC